MLGITGPPGAGKSTLTEQLAAALGPGAAVVPLDGFHLADVTLDAHGSRRRKGAVDTFDGWGYLHLVRRLRDETDHAVFAPGFERDLEQPIAAAIEVPPSARLVITEGNYLLHPDPPWSLLRAELDEVWYCALDDGVRRQRLVARHVRFGKEPHAATRWVERVDDPNATQIAARGHLADRVVAIG